MAVMPRIDPDRWAVEVFDLEKRFISRQGLPMGWGFGDAHWIISSIIKYGKQIVWCRAVDGVSFKVGRGELFGLLGPNGAGKTTLLKCLATLLKVNGGQAFVNGFDIERHPDEVKLSINLVGSGHWVAFDWGMTVEENLHFFGCLYGQSKAERKANIEATLELLGLKDIAKRTPRGLSSGERQRMLLAKGFLVRTPVFFLDEPTVSLDPSGAREIRNFIKNELVGSSGTSAILTTHRMAEAEELCDRIAIMDRGKIVACGTSEELKARTGKLTVIEIRCSGLSQEIVDEIAELEGVTAVAGAAVGEESLEESLRVHCADTEVAVGKILDVLERRGTTVLSVEMEEPTLEDAFLALTKRRLE